MMEVLSTHALNCVVCIATVKVFSLTRIQTPQLRLIMHLTSGRAETQGLKRKCCQVSSSQAQAHEPLKALPHNQTDLLQLSANKKLQAMQVCDIPEREASLSLIRLLLLLRLLLSGLTPACALFVFLDLLQSLHMTWKQKVKLMKQSVPKTTHATPKHTTTLFVVQL